jgi:hypothetical protein
VRHTPDLPCWLCRQFPPPPAAPPDPLAAVPRGRFQFGISSLLLIMTLVCIIGSITRMAPGLGVAIMILGVPALIHTCVVASRQAAGGRPMSSPRKALSFTVALLTAFAVTGLALGAAMAAFFVVCTVGIPLMQSSGKWAPFVLGAAGLAAFGAAVATVVGFFLIYANRRRRGRRRRAGAAAGLMDKSDLWTGPIEP